MNATYWTGVVFAVIVLIAVFLRMRNSGMKERYATWWIVIAVGVMVFSVFPNALKGVASLLGIQVPLNLALVVAAVVLLLLTLRISVDLSQAGEERRRLTEEIAILDLRVRCLEAALTQESASTDDDASLP
ncbi:MAG: DUF2304 domain-containing protein [Schaalia hyovaginalis]|uniref:DUF2304 domain-containing protein n=1 Tax=Schaalia hyovaginalis TaxID=29316 RepID=UPI002A91E6CA|nr:DUF2304 domain-containing protein [Schaalia hyovaginalis]MDY6213818.1 DUF2304 domain-containing protein [Schaalia hyovaginalis]